MINGFLLIDKPENMTSNDVVRILKKKFQQKKIGHSGTLDPNATGLLVVALGQATKFLPYVTKESKKRYIATFDFGMYSDSLDKWTQITARKKTIFHEVDKFEAVCKSFVKTYLQYPPVYSAKKVNGKRLYEYARNNEKVKITPSLVSIYQIELLNYNQNFFTIDATVSKGTYIRSLGYNIAQETNNICVMSSLRRLSSDGFDLEDAIKLEKVEENNIIELKTFIMQNFSVVEVYGQLLKYIQNGNQLKVHESISYPCVYVDQENKKMLAIYDKFGEITKPLVMLGDI